jgi:hypothetical protein
MLKRHRQMAMRREAAHTPRGPVDAMAAGIARVLNEPREARREVEQGHVVRGLVDAATAAADLQLARGVIRGVHRGHVKLGGSHSHKQTRKWLGQKGLAEKGQHAHHALIPNNGWGKAIPDVIKNQPWNYKMTETPLHHIRIHGASRKFGLPQFGVLERYLHGTPTWWKAANGSALGHGVQATANHLGSHAPATQSHHHPSSKK